MAALRPQDVRYIVIHTADASMRNVDAKEIDLWHKQRGWSGIGYHYVILNDRHDTKDEGTLEKGRPIHLQGAHVAGINHMSVGICCVGKGDAEPFSAKQMKAMLDLIAELRRRFDVPPENVIGHREVNKMVDAGQLAPKFRTPKACPGKKVSMEEIRAAVRARDEQESALPSREVDLRVVDPGTPDLIWLPNLQVVGDETLVSDGEEMIA